MKNMIKMVMASFFVLFMASYSFAVLTVTKTTNKQGTTLGANISYVIFLQNSGPGNVTGVEVWDSIPFRSTYVSSAPAGVLSGGMRRWNPGTIAAGGAYSITLTVKVDDDINTPTANIRNVASVLSAEEGYIESMPVFTTVVKTYTYSDKYVTYGGWVDRDSKNMGFLHVYTLAENTTVKLYETDTAPPNTINTVNPISAGLGLDGITVHSAGKVIDYPTASPMLLNYDGDGDHSVGNGFSTRYFKLEANKPILWVFDSIVDENWADSFIFAMSTDYKFSGSTFYTHLNYDRNPYSAGNATSMDFGDSIAIVNTNPFDIAAYVYRSTDNGTNWYLSATNTVKMENPVHAAGSAGGIWFYGGTTITVEGDCKIVLREKDALGNDVGDASGIVWKGNFFAGSQRPNNDTNHRDSDHDNANAFGISVNGSKVSKAGSDVIYGCVGVSDDPVSGRGELVLTNIGAVAANVSIYKYNPDSSIYRDPVSPLGGSFGNSGVWEIWLASYNVPAGSSTTLYNGSSVTIPQGEYYGSFYKVVVNSGGPIEANGGSNIHAALYGQADYLEATDTNISVGTDFYFGNASWNGYGGDWWKKNAGGCFLAFCPKSGTTVTVNGLLSTVDIGYPGVSANVQTSTTDDQVLQFHSISTNVTYHITSTAPVFLMVQNLKGREKVFSGVSVAAVYLSANPVLMKSASSVSVQDGDIFTYTLQFANGGAGSAENVVITDTLPAGVTYQSSSPAPSSVVGDVYSWNLSTVAPGTAEAVRLIVQTAGCGFNITNTAISFYEDQVFAPQPAITSEINYVAINCIPTATNTYTITQTYTLTPTMTHTLTVTPSYTVTNTPIVPQFTLAKSVLPGSAGRGETVTYTIAYRNTGLIAITNLAIWDTVPTQLENVSNISSGGIYTSATGLINWIVGSVGLGASGSLSFTATLKNTVTRGEIIPNTASGNAPGGAGTVISNISNVTANVPLLELTPVTNYPNPFDGDTTIVFDLTLLADNCSIKFFTISGEPVKTMDFTEMKSPIPGGNLQISSNGAGGWTYKVYWDGTNAAGNKLSSGIYLYRIKASAGNEEKKAMGRLAILR